MSAFMALAIPPIGSTTYATNINAALTTIDGHTHAPGSGATLTPYRVDPVSGYTTSQVLTAAQSGSVVHNQGAAGSVTFTLPSASLNPGCYYMFVTITGQNIVIQATNGAVMQGTGGFSSANGTLTVTTGNAVIQLVSAGGNWYQRSTPVGTWTPA